MTEFRWALIFEYHAQTYSVTRNVFTNISVFCKFRNTKWTVCITGHSPQLGKA